MSTEDSFSTALFGDASAKAAVAKPSAPTASAAPSAAPPTLPVAAPAAPAWSLARRVAFRFVFVYLVLYNLPFPMGTIPRTEAIAGVYEEKANAAAAWLGTFALGFAEPPGVFPTGSGDTPIQYCRSALFAAIALVATLAWCGAGRLATGRSTSLEAWFRAHPRLEEFLRVYVRFSLGATMLGYGFAKVFKSQFQMPEGESLFTPLGQKSPMGLLWSFMGFSTFYTIFVGAAECLGGALLFFRRTVTLGAILVAAVMLNVTILNFCYDVPVKLYASHLCAMAVVLALPESRRLALFFFTRRPVPPPAPVLLPPVIRRWRVTRWVYLSIGPLVGLALIGWSGWGGYQSWLSYGESAERPPLSGTYTVTRFERDGEEVPLTSYDARLWSRVTLSRRGFAAIATLPESVAYYGKEVDAGALVVKLTGGSGPRTKPPTEASESYLWFDEPEPGRLVLSGPFDGAALRVELKPVDDDACFLRARGFRWMQDYPVNR